MPSCDSCPSASVALFAGESRPEKVKVLEDRVLSSARRKGDGSDAPFIERLRSRMGQR